MDDWDIRRDCFQPLAAVFNEAASEFDDYQSSDIPLDSFLNAVGPLIVLRVQWGTVELGRPTHVPDELNISDDMREHGERVERLIANAGFAELWLCANLSDGIAEKFRRTIRGASARIAKGVSLAAAKAKKADSEGHHWDDYSASTVWDALTHPVALMDNIARLVDNGKRGDPGRNPERDAFIVKRRSEGASYKTIMVEISKRPEWEQIATVQGVRGVMERRK